MKNSGVNLNRDILLLLHGGSPLPLDLGLAVPFRSDNWLGKDRQLDQIQLEVWIVYELLSLPKMLSNFVEWSNSSSLRETHFSLQAPFLSYAWHPFPSICIPIFVSHSFLPIR